MKNNEITKKELERRLDNAYRLLERECGEADIKGDKNQFHSGIRYALGVIKLEVLTGCASKGFKELNI